MDLSGATLDSILIVSILSNSPRNELLV